MTVRPEQTARTLRRRALAADQERRVRAARIREQVVAYVHARLDAGSRAWLIGSLAWGGFAERSDVDLVLDGVTSDRASEIELGLVRELQVEVDVLQLEDLSEAFRRRVLDEGVPIHER